MSWIKIEDSIAAPLRACIATIALPDFVHYSRRPAYMMFTLFQRGTNPQVAESLARECLEQMYEQAKHWTILQIGFSMSRQAVEVVVQHPSFDVVSVGNELLRLTPTIAVSAEACFHGSNLYHVSPVANATS